MRSINFPMLLLAILVILMFSATGVAIAYGHIWYIILFFILGTAIMGYGISLKKKNDSSV